MSTQPCCYTIAWWHFPHWILFFGTLLVLTFILGVSYSIQEPWSSLAIICQGTWYRFIDFFTFPSIFLFKNIHFSIPRFIQRTNDTSHYNWKTIRFFSTSGVGVLYPLAIYIIHCISWTIEVVTRPLFCFEKEQGEAEESKIGLWLRAIQSCFLGLWFAYITIDQVDPLQLIWLIQFQAS